MKTAQLEKQLRGPVLIATTPMTADHRPDLDAWPRLADHWVGSGFGKQAGVVLLCGAGGDNPHLSWEEWKEVARAGAEAIAGRIPFMVGIQELSTRHTIQACAFASELGAAAVQVAPPHYFPPSFEDIQRFYSTVAAEGGAKLMVYNTYWFGVDLSVEQYQELARIPGVVAVKWAKPNAAAMAATDQLVDHLLVFDNSGLLIETHARGGHGFVSNMCDFYPPIELEVWQLLESGAYREAAHLLSAKTRPFYDFRVKMARRTLGESCVKRAALELMGLPAGPPPPPARPLNEEERAELRGILLAAGVPLATSGS